MAKKKKQELTSEEKLAAALVREDEQPYAVPRNWVWVRLGALCQVKGGKRLPKGHHLVDDKTEYPYIRVTNFNEHSISVDEVKYIWPETYEKINRYTISKDDIYISIAGTIGKVGIIPDCLNGGNLTENAAKITNLNGLTQKYLLYILTSTNLQQQISKSTISTTQPKLALFRIEDLMVPLPPLAEQQRIVDRIESLFDKLDQAKDLIQEALDSFENRKAAILHQAFTGELTKKWRAAHGLGMESWEEKIFGETDIQIIDGDRGKNYPKKNEFTNKGYCLYLNTKNVTKNGFVFKELQFISKEKDEILRKGKLQREDVILTTRGTVGNIAYYDSDITFENIRINSGMVIFRGGLDFYKPFLCYLFKSEYITSQISSLKTGSAQPQLPINIMKNLNLVIPSIKEQQEIVRILVDLFAKEQNAKDLCDLIDQIEAMKKTILGQAFRGELGTNEAGEESAVALLKQVLKEKVKAKL